MAAPTLAANATEAQALAYLRAFWGSAVYQNAASTPYNGMTAAQVYAYLKGKTPSATPYQLAQATSDLMLSSAVGGAIGAGATQLGPIVSGTEQGLASTSFLPSLDGLLSGLASGSLWLRVAEGVLGIVLIAVGLARLTGAVPAATSIAKAVK